MVRRLGKARISPVELLALREAASVPPVPAARAALGVGAVTRFGDETFPLTPRDGRLTDEKRLRERNLARGLVLAAARFRWWRALRKSAGLNLHDVEQNAASQIEPDRLGVATWVKADERKSERDDAKAAAKHFGHAIGADGRSQNGDASTKNERFGRVRRRPFLLMGLDMG